MMGNRVLIVDNRQIRAQRWMADQWDVLKALPNVLIKESVPEEQFILSFDVVAIHGSLIGQAHLETLLAQLVKEKHVILFSGDYNQMVLSNEGHLLKVPAIDFYSQNLIPFCEYMERSDAQSIQLLALVYGVSHCRLPIMLQLRQLLWQFSEGKLQHNQKRKIEELKSALSLKDDADLGDEITKEFLFR